MILVNLHRNYSYPDLRRQTPLNDGKWIDIEVSECEAAEADYCIIFNYPLKDIKIKVKKGGVWLFLQEPPASRNKYYTMYFRFVDKVFSAYSGDKTKFVQQTTCLPWHVNKSYSELKKLSHVDMNKRDEVSWITSNNNLIDGHQLRLDFMNFLNIKRFQYHLFGRGFNPIDDKFDGIAPYKYSIAIENYAGPDYWTEKIQDCFLSWTMPIYYGCTNLPDYFPKESYIQIDPNNHEESLEIVREAILNKSWDKNIDAIRYSRELILDKYQFFPYLKSLIDEFEAKSKKRHKTFLRRIPASGLTKFEQLKKRIKQIGT